MSVDINKVLRAKTVEPKKRLKGNKTPDWIIHKYPIKGGISLRDVLLIELARPNPLFRLIKERNQNAKNQGA